MMRRTPLFQELLYTMVNSPNPHGYGKEKRFKYRFGFFGFFSEVSTDERMNKSETRTLGSFTNLH